MTHDDETVEREISKSPWPARVQLGAHVFQNSYDDGSYYCYELRASMKFADAAALSALPERSNCYECGGELHGPYCPACAGGDELLREALSALEPFADKAGDYIYEDPAHHGIVFISDLRRARAAADKIRAAMEHDKGEGL